MCKKSIIKNSKCQSCCSCGAIHGHVESESEYGIGASVVFEEAFSESFRIARGGSGAELREGGGVLVNLLIYLAMKRALWWWSIFFLNLLWKVIIESSFPTLDTKRVPPTYRLKII